MNDDDDFKRYIKNLFGHQKILLTSDGRDLLKDNKFLRRITLQDEYLDITVTKTKKKKIRIDIVKP